MTRSEPGREGGSELLVLDQELIKQKDYWIERLGHQTEPAKLFFDHPRAGRQHLPKVRTHEVSLDGPAFVRLMELTGDSPFLTYTALMAALKICVYRYTGSSTVTIGSPARKQPAGSGTMANALAIVDQIDDRETFKDVLGNVRQTLLDAYVRQQYPYHYLVRDLALDAPENRTPLFNILLSLDPLHGETLDLDNDITLKFRKEPDRLAGTIEFDEALFGSDSVRQFGNHLMNLLEKALQNPGALVANLPLLTEQERKRLLVELNSTRAEFPGDKTIDRLFEEQVELSPDACALVFKQDRLTYGELNVRANQLARYLQSQGFRPEAIAGICLERGLDLIVAILGVIKAGGTYLPMDSEYPESRLEFMAKDAEIDLLITQHSMTNRVPRQNGKTVYMDRDLRSLRPRQESNPETSVVSDFGAYIIYTSGSTGQPNGVLISHRALSNLILETISVLGFKRGAHSLQVCSLSFDGSVLEIFSTLLSGGTLFLTTREERLSGEMLTNLIQREGVELAVTTPPILSMLRARDLPGLRGIAVGGERCVADLGNQWSTGRILLNIYGPTETTIYSLSGIVKPSSSRDPSIGRHVANLRAYLLDHCLEPVPIGIPGEICVGGIGLSRGYVNRPDKTAEKFVPDPFSPSPGERIYRTGDLGKYLPDGEVDFLGRIDNQVKVKGYRIELDEIESVLSQCPGISTAVVLARDDVREEKEIIAYAVGDLSQEITAKSMRAFLQDRLPSYMVPSAFVVVDAMPLTVHGKIDRRALPSPAQSEPEMDDNFVAARTPTEEMLAGMWSELLGVERVGIQDNFFELGGRSLNATQVMSRIRNAFQIELPLDTLFNTPTVADLASLVEKARSVTVLPPMKRVSREGPLPLSFAQQRLWFLDQITPADAHDLYNGPLNFRLSGPIDRHALGRSLREIIARHETLRTAFLVVNGEPAQVIFESVQFSLKVTDLRSFPKADREAEAHRLADLDAKRAFDLGVPPLVRAELLQLDEHEHILLMTIHHIVFDIWSMGVFAREVLALYEAFSKGKPVQLTPLQVGYADFAQWQREWLQGEVLEEQLAYWKTQLADLPELYLPTDKPRPAAPSFRGELVVFHLPLPLATALKSLSRREGATQFMVLTAAFKALLYRYSGQEDLVTSTAIANRNWAEIEPLIGFFVNTLVLRTDMSGAPTFRELIGRVRKVTLDAYSHQDLPFEKLVEELRPDRDTSHAPMFRTMIGLLNIPIQTKVNIPELTVTQFKTHNRAAKFDVILRMTDTDEGLKGEIEYDTDLFERTTIERMAAHFRTIIETVVVTPDVDLIDIPLEKSDREEPVEAALSLSSRLNVQQFEF